MTSSSLRASGCDQLWRPPQLIDTSAPLHSTAKPPHGPYCVFQYLTREKRRASHSPSDPSPHPVSAALPHPLKRPPRRKPNSSPSTPPNHGRRPTQRPTQRPTPRPARRGQRKRYFPLPPSSLPSVPHPLTHPNPPLPPQASASRPTATPPATKSPPPSRPSASRWAKVSRRPRRPSAASSAPWSTTASWRAGAPRAR